MKQKVVIIGQYYNNRLALLRPLGELGYDISVVVLERNANKPIDSYSKYVTNYYLCPEETEENIIRVLMTDCIDEIQKVILIPSDDYSVFIIDKNYDILKNHFLFPSIHKRQGAVIEWMDKERQKALARELGLNVANSNSVKIVNGLYTIPSDITYPCFTKAQTFVLKAKNVLHRCEDRKDLEDKLDSICRKYKDIDVMIEDYKSIDREYAVVGFSDGKEAIIPGVIEIVSMGQGNGAGVAKTGKIVPIDGYEKLIEKFKEYVLRIGFIGIFDIDFYLCKDVFYFGELNLRFGGSGYVIIKKGIDLPVMMAKTFLGEKLDGMKRKITTSSSYANEKTCLYNWYSGYMTTIDFIHIMKSSDFTLIKDKKDPAPEKIFMRYFIRMWVKRIAKRIYKIFQE